MSQVHVPDMENGLKIELFTWGSCRRGFAEIIYPEKIDLVSMTGKYGKHVVQLPFATIVYDNSDSRKNMRRHVTIVATGKIVIRYYGSGSCNPNARFNDVYVLEPGKEPVKLDALTKTITAEYGKHLVTKLIEYVFVDDKEIIVSEREIERKKIKLTIYVRRQGDTVELSGDTYELREKLKAHGFKWNAEKKTWTGIQLPPLENVEIIEVSGQ